MINTEPVDTFLLLLLAIVLAASWLALRRAGRDGLPHGRVVYSDTGDWRPPEKPLFSNRHRLTGKPDYLVETGHGIIPVEIKSGKSPVQPYASHVLQLAAYCLLIEDTMNQTPRYGLIQYSDCVFRIDYTPGLRRQLMGVLDKMRSDAQREDVSRNHQEPRRCSGCGYHEQCDQALVS
jgi:CRISPR-associated exonuclease Cas4